MKKTKNIVKKLDLWETVLLCLCIIVIGALSVFTFRGGNLNFNSDCATANILAEEIVRTGSYFPEQWVCGQDLWFFGLHTFIAVLTLFLDDYILMHSLASVIVIVMAVAACIYCSRKVTKSNMWTVAVPLLFCGISAEYDYYVFGQCAYVFPMAYMFLIAGVYISSMDENVIRVKSRKKFALLLGLIAFVGFTGLRYIQAIDIPLLGAIVILYIYEHHKDDIRSFFVSAVPSVINAAVISGAVIAGFAGFMLMSSLVHFSWGATALSLTEADIWGQLSKFVNCFIKLFGISYEAQLFTADGIFSCIKIAAGVMLLIVFPALQIRKFPEEDKPMQFFIIYSCIHILEIVILAIFTGILPPYISRYLFTAEFLLLFLSANYIYKYLIQKVSSSVKLISVTALSVYAVICVIPNIVSSLGYEEKMSEQTALTEYLKSKGYSYGYATYWNSARYTVLSNGEVEICEISVDEDDGVTKQCWLNSLDRYEAHSGDCFLLLTDSENDIFIDSDSIKAFGVPKSVEQFSAYDEDYWIYGYGYNLAENDFKGDVPREELDKVMAMQPDSAVYRYDVTNGKCSPYDHMYFSYDDASMFMGSGNGGDILLIGVDPEGTPYGEFILDNYTKFETSYGPDIYYSDKNLMDASTGLPSYIRNNSVDFVYSGGVENRCEYKDGKWVTSGNEGMAFFGPYAEAAEGRFRFTLHYSYEEDSSDADAEFDVCVDDGQNVLASVKLSDDENTAVIEAEFEGEEIFEYRLRTQEGARIRIDYIEMECLD